MSPKILLILQSLGAAGQGAAESSEHAIVFIVAIGLILLVGRLLSELMQRIGQPAVMGQLLASVVIGQSVLGAMWPSAYSTLFGSGTEQRHMIDAIAQLGVPLLLVADRHGDGPEFDQPHAEHGILHVVIGDCGSLRMRLCLRPVLAGLDSA